jgi:hypothetical protein
MNNSGDIEFIAAWNEVQYRDWQAPKGLCRNWLANLPAGLRVPMLDVVDLLAFGAAMQPDGLSRRDIWGRRILATQTLLRGVASGALAYYGQRVELLNNGALYGLSLKPLGLPGRIAAQEFANDALTLSPFNPKWLSLALIASDLALWGKPEAVSYVDLTCARDLLDVWIGELSGTVATGRPKGTGYAIKDEPLVVKMLEMRDDGRAKSLTEAAKMVIGRNGSGALGIGSPEAKISRLVKRATATNQRKTERK